MSRDLRQYNRQTNRRLIIGGLVLLFVVGIGLIYLIYGAGAALSGLLCLSLGMLPLLAIWLFFILLDWFVHRSRND